MNCRNCNNAFICSLSDKARELDGLLTVAASEKAPDAFEKDVNIIINVLSETLPKFCGRYNPSKKLPLTKTRAKILAVIKNLLCAKGYFPTIREVGRKLGRSEATIHEHIRRLVRDGYLRQEGPALDKYILADDL